jgi:hypothetical protein
MRVRADPFVWTTLPQAFLVSVVAVIDGHH